MASTSLAPSSTNAHRKRPRMTYAEFQAWYDREAGRWGELVHGQVIQFVAPKMIHQRISGFLFGLMSLHARDLDLGEVVQTPEMKLGAGEAYRQPDIAFIAAENADRVTSDGIDGPADLVVEIVSEDSVARDKVEKLSEYRDAGVREYWVVDPRPLRRSVVVYALTDEGDYEPIQPDRDGRFVSRVLTGLAIDPIWLSQEPLPDPREKLAEISGAGDE